MNNIPRDPNWHKCNTQVFWGEIAPCDHLIQIYENDDVILDCLQGFVSSGFNSGDSVIIIATGPHLQALKKRLTKAGYDLRSLIASNQYISMEAEQCLAKFMVHGWPVEHKFTAFVNDVVSKARGEHDKMRAYGEMVAILWEQGHSGATVQLEHLWNFFCTREAFCLFCAYPRSGFTQDLGSSVNHICSAHTKMIAGDFKSTTEIFYKSA